MKHRQITHYIDLLFCIVILPLIIMMLPVDKWIVHQPAFLTVLVSYLYALYFVYRKVKLPQLVMQRKYVKALVVFALLLVVTELVSRFPMPDSEGSPVDIRVRNHFRTQTVWFFFLIVTGFSLAIELIYELFRQRLQQQEIETEKNKAMLAAYKSQINPHFLFNTLNALYGLVVSNSSHTEAAFIKFSNILKYMYSQTDVEKIDIDSEISYIRQYVDLQKLRLNHHTKVELECDIDDGSGQVPPMILITFIENVFKYGSSPDEDCTIFICIKESGGVLTMITRNRVMKERSEDAMAVGMENCRKRLQLLFPGQYELNTQLLDGVYVVNLTIRLK